AGCERRAAPAQARQFARALPGPSPSARGLLRACRAEAAAGARGVLLPGGSGAGAPTHGGIGCARSTVLHRPTGTICLLLAASLGALEQRGAKRRAHRRRISTRTNRSD